MRQEEEEKKDVRELESETFHLRDTPVFQEILIGRDLRNEMMDWRFPGIPLKQAYGTQAGVYRLAPPTE